MAPSQRTRRSLQFLHAIMDRFRFGFGAELPADPEPAAAAAVPENMLYAAWPSGGEFDRPLPFMWTSPSS